MYPPLKSVEEELADCRAAFAAYPKTGWLWRCHHEVHIEQLKACVEDRIDFIHRYKDYDEQACRFRNLRPVRVKLPCEVVDAWQLFQDAEGSDILGTHDDFKFALEDWSPELKALHDQDWPDNTWNGISIFEGVTAKS